MTQYTRFALVALLAVASSAALPQTAPLQLLRDFESGTLDGWAQVRENVPVVTTERARAGKYSMKAVLRADALTTWGKERNEMQAKGSEPRRMNESTWYGFSVFLPQDYTADKVWELVTQWYPNPDDPAETGRQPTLALFTTNGIWSVANKTSSEVVTPIYHASIRQRTWELGPLQLNKWTDFVFNVKWTHLDTGFLKVWKDGILVIDHKGPTSYNDQKGPFVKQGIYKGWAKMAVDKVKVRTVYHDEVRIAGPDGSYAAVAPGGGTQNTVVPTPKPPTELSVR